MKSDCPEPSPSFAAALKEVFSLLLKQKRDPSFALVRSLPPTARPYKFDAQTNAGSGAIEAS
ncbi:hypothetical protein CH50_05465 [Paenibacillus darwinianus]|nr:hypothetical protein CH50_05465 [Paenibacillus darwinianus]